VANTLLEVDELRVQYGGVQWAIEVAQIDDVVDRYPTELSHGQRKLVGVTRALARRPKLLLLDEPAAGLDTDETRELGGRLRRVTEAGVTLLLIDHDMGPRHPGRRRWRRLRRRPCCPSRAWPPASSASPPSAT
jgi:branched-chain amino acid transport system ATP-binding protein